MVLFIVFALGLFVVFVFGIGNINRIRARSININIHSRGRIIGIVMRHRIITRVCVHMSVVLSVSVNIRIISSYSCCGCITVSMCASDRIRLRHNTHIV